MPDGMWDPRALRETARIHCIKKASGNEPASPSLFFEWFYSKMGNTRECESVHLGLRQLQVMLFERACCV